MSDESRKRRRVAIREILDDAEAVAKKQFPYISEETNEYRITVLSIANMLVQVSGQDS